MLHPDDFEIRLGFDHIRRKLTHYCLSQLGVSYVDAIQFSGNYQHVATALRQNLEFKQIFEKGENFPSNHYNDVREVLKKASLEGNYIDEPEFLQLAYAQQTILACRDFLVKSKEFYPTLFELTAPIAVQWHAGTIDQ